METSFTKDLISNNLDANLLKQHRSPPLVCWAPFYSLLGAILL